MAFPDVVMLLPGISGSTLSRDGHVIWGTSLGGIWNAIMSGGDSIRSLALTHGDDHTEDDIDGVQATSLIPDLHLIPGLWKIDGYTKVAHHLVSQLGLTEGQNFFPFPYDWRRDNRVSARKLGRFARDKLARWRESSGNSNAKLIFVTHSMGGLVARVFMDGPDQGWKDTRALITLGTPHRGSLNALGYLVNGFSKKIGPVKVDLSDVVRTFTGLYQLLPAYPCVDTGAGQLARVSQAGKLPDIDEARAAQSAAFYQQLEDQNAQSRNLPGYAEQGPRWFPVVGTFQPTVLSARLAGGALTLLKTRNGQDEGGDGTVPRGSAMPTQLASSSAGMFAEQVHGSLQNDDAVLDQIVASIQGLQINYGAYRAGEIKASLDLEDAYAADEPVPLRVRTSEAVSSVTARIYDARVPAGQPAVQLDQVTLQDRGGGTLTADVMLAEGAYRVVVGGEGGNVAPTSDCILVVARGG